MLLWNSTDITLIIFLFVTVWIHQIHCTNYSCCSFVDYSSLLAEFQKCSFNDCPIFCRYTVWSSCRCGWHSCLAQYVLCRHPANILPLWPLKCLWWPMKLHENHFTVAKFLEHGSYAANPPMAIIQTGHIGAACMTGRLSVGCCLSTDDTAANKVSFLS